MPNQVIHKEFQYHDGQITVESEEGIGTTFRVMLPVVEKSYPQMNADEKANQDLQKPAREGSIQ